LITNISCLRQADGSCLDNGKKGASAGIGVWFGDNDIRNVCEPMTTGPATNHRAELAAVVRASEILRESGTKNTEIKILTDSSYVSMGSKTWLSKWESNGWVTAAGNPVANQDLWMELRDELDSNGKVQIEKVEGHSGNVGNDKADALARMGAAMRR
jgi:ribonuclease HI